MSSLRSRIKITGSTGSMVKKWNLYVDQYYATAEGNRLVHGYLANSSYAVIEVKLIPGGFKNFVRAAGTVNIGLASQSGFGQRYAKGKGGTKILLVGLRTLAHEMFHALDLGNRHHEQSAVASANKVIRQRAVSDGNPSKAGERGNYNDPTYPVPFGATTNFLS